MNIKKNVLIVLDGHLLYDHPGLSSQKICIKAQMIEG